MSKPLDIRALRESINWKQEQLAQFLGVERSSVSHMENGRPANGPVKRLLNILKDAADNGLADELVSRSEAAE